MRIASVLHAASPDHDGAPLLPTLALERDGALYGVVALARAFGGRHGLSALAEGEGADFHHAVVALSGAPLCELDDRLKRGERPTEARLRPGRFTWLPPCDVERAAVFEQITGERWSEEGAQCKGPPGERRLEAPVAHPGAPGAPPTRPEGCPRAP